MSEKAFEMCDNFVNQLVAEAERDESIAFMSILAKDHGEDGPMEVMLGVFGYYSVLEEALLAEVLDQMQKGNTGLYMSLRNVVNAVEISIGIDDAVGSGGTGKRVLH